VARSSGRHASPTAVCDGNGTDERVTDYDGDVVDLCVQFIRNSPVARKRIEYRTRTANVKTRRENNTTDDSCGRNDGDDNIVIT